MTVRFQADVNPNQIILLAARRREPALDFQTALQAELSGVNDPEILARAAREGRILVTHDRKTMPRHFFAFITTTTRSIDCTSISSGRCCGRRPLTTLAC